MASIVDTLQSQLGEEGIQAISRRLGIDPATAQQAVTGALPILTGALAKNAATPGGADALHQALDAHDGSLLERATEYLGQGSTGDGEGILGHLLGGHRSAAENGLAQATGVDAGTAGQVLAMLAPLVLGALGRARNQQGLDPGSLAGVLQAEHVQAASAPPAGVLGVLSGVLGSLGQGGGRGLLGSLGGLFGKR